MEGVQSVVTAPALTMTAVSSVYVGDLHPDVTEDVLYDVFAEFKSLASVRVCKDTTTGRSHCYGYVNFTSPQDATRAIETRNNSVLKGKMIRVMWSHKDSDARKNGVGNVFIKNLCESVDNARLQDMFQKFGNIVSCKVSTFEDGKSKGYGFVQFERDDSAVAAIQKLNGTTVGDKQIYVARFVKKSDRKLPNPDIKYTNLYMKNLDHDVSEEILREKFGVFGKIISLAIQKDDNGSSRGFGFVNFESSDDARRAKETMNGTQLHSKVLYVARAQKKAEREQVLHHQFEEKRKEQILKYKGSNLYVKNVDDDVTDEELRDLFSQCGTITSSVLMRDDKGISRGFGFVCFSSQEEAKKALQTLHGKMFHRKPLYVSIAQRKEERQAHLKQQLARHKAAIAAGSSNPILPGTYPPFYFATPPGGVSQVAPQHGLMYQTLGLNPVWRPAGFAPPSRPAFQPSSLPMIPNVPRHNRQSRGRINEHVAPQSVSYMQQSTRLVPSPKDMTHQQVKYINNGHGREGSVSVEIKPRGSQTLSSILTAAPPSQQKQILGEHLYPLVEKHQPDLVGKVTGMLLELDNSELLLLIESPEHLAVKVEEAVRILKLSKSKGSDQDSLLPQILSAEVSVS